MAAYEQDRENQDPQGSENDEFQQNDWDESSCRGEIPENCKDKSVDASDLAESISKIVPGLLESYSRLFGPQKPGKAETKTAKVEEAASKEASKGTGKEPPGEERKEASKEPDKAANEKVEPAAKKPTAGGTEKFSISWFNPAALAADALNTVSRTFFAPAEEKGFENLSKSADGEVEEVDTPEGRFRLTSRAEDGNHTYLRLEPGKDDEGQPFVGRVSIENGKLKISDSQTGKTREYAARPAQYDLLYTNSEGKVEELEAGGKTFRYIGTADGKDRYLVMSKDDPEGQEFNGSLSVKDGRVTVKDNDSGLTHSYRKEKAESATSSVASLYESTRHLTVSTTRAFVGDKAAQNVDAVFKDPSKLQKWYSEAVASAQKAEAEKGSAKPAAENGGTAKPGGGADAASVKGPGGLAADLAVTKPGDGKPGEAKPVMPVFNPSLPAAEKPLTSPVLSNVISPAQTEIKIGDNVLPVSSFNPLDRAPLIGTDGKPVLNAFIGDLRPTATIGGEQNLLPRNLLPANLIQTNDTEALARTILADTLRSPALLPAAFRPETAFPPNSHFESFVHKNQSIPASVSASPRITELAPVNKDEELKKHPYLYSPQLREAVSPSFLSRFPISGGLPSSILARSSVLEAELSKLAKLGGANPEAKVLTQNPALNADKTFLPGSMAELKVHAEQALKFIALTAGGARAELFLLGQKVEPAALTIASRQEGKIAEPQGKPLLDSGLKIAGSGISQIAASQNLGIQARLLDGRNISVDSQQTHLVSGQARGLGLDTQLRGTELTARFTDAGGRLLDGRLVDARILDARQAQIRGDLVAASRPGALGELVGTRAVRVDGVLDGQIAALSLASGRRSQEGRYMIAELTLAMVLAAGGIRRILPSDRSGKDAGRNQGDRIARIDREFKSKIAEAARAEGFKQSTFKLKELSLESVKNRLRLLEAAREKQFVLASGGRAAFKSLAFAETSTLKRKDRAEQGHLIFAGQARKTFSQTLIPVAIDASANIAMPVFETSLDRLIRENEQMLALALDPIIGAAQDFLDMADPFAVGASGAGDLKAKKRRKRGTNGGSERKSENNLRDSSPDDDEQNESETTKTLVLLRPKYLIGETDTLLSIAEEHFSDPYLGWLIADLNKDNCREHTMDGKRIVEFQSRQQITLPVWQDIVDFYGSMPDQAKPENLITIVSATEIDREVVESVLGPIVAGKRSSSQNLAGEV